MTLSIGVGFSVTLLDVSNIEAPGSPVMNTRPLVDSVGDLDILLDSGTDQSDGLYTLPDSSTVTDIIGVDNAGYEADGTPIPISWVDLQEAAALSPFLYVGLLGVLLYSTNMSAYEDDIMSYLGGLYVVSTPTRVVMSPGIVMSPGFVMS